MIKIEDLKKDPILKGLTEEQMRAVATLSENDEDVVIGEHRRTWWDRLDNDVMEVFGERKLEHDKSFETFKRALVSVRDDAKLGTKSKHLKRDLDAANAKVEELKGKFEAGTGDETLKNELAAERQKVRDLTDEIASTKETYEDKLKDSTSELGQLREKVTISAVNRSAEGYRSDKGLQWNEAIPKTTRNEIFDTRVNRFLSTHKVEEDESLGRLIIRGEDGSILRNPEQQNAPYEVGQYLFDKVLTDLVKAGSGGGGTGGKKPGARGSGGSAGVSIDLSSVGSKEDALLAIRSHVTKQEGIPKTDPAFQERVDTIKGELGVDEHEF